MWISKRLSERRSPAVSESGQITMTSNNRYEAASTVNARNIVAYQPYGYQACLPTGEETLLIPSADGLSAIGVKAKETALEAGEIMISSKGGASILLKNDGSVVINHTLVINREGEIEN